MRPSLLTVVSLISFSLVGRADACHWCGHYGHHYTYSTSSRAAATTTQRTYVTQQLAPVNLAPVQFVPMATMTVDTRASSQNLLTDALTDILADILRDRLSGDGGRVSGLSGRVTSLEATVRRNTTDITQLREQHQEVTNIINDRLTALEAGSRPVITESGPSNVDSAVELIKRKQAELRQRIASVADTLKQLDALIKFKVSKGPVFTNQQIDADRELLKQHQEELQGLQRELQSLSDKLGS